MRKVVADYLIPPATPSGRYRHSTKLQGHYPQLEQMAAMLNVSARTYRRRLAAESTSFQSLLDQSRLKFAKQQLFRGETVLGTALSLGFNDASNFRRAFSQWCGQSPAQWQDNISREVSIAPAISLNASSRKIRCAESASK